MQLRVIPELQVHRVSKAHRENRVKPVHKARKESREFKVRPVLQELQVQMVFQSSGSAVLQLPRRILPDSMPTTTPRQDVLTSMTVLSGHFLLRRETREIRVNKEKPDLRVRKVKLELQEHRLPGRAA